MGISPSRVERYLWAWPMLKALRPGDYQEADLKIDIVANLAAISGCIFYVYIYNYIYIYISDIHTYILYIYTIYIYILDIHIYILDIHINIIVKGCTMVHLLFLTSFHCKHGDSTNKKLGGSMSHPQ